jgi:hypothetical protein
VGDTTAGLRTMTPSKHMASQYLYLVRDCRTYVLVFIFASTSCSPNANRRALCGARLLVVWSAFAERIRHQADPAPVDGAIRWKALRNRLFPKVQARPVPSK